LASVQPPGRAKTGGRVKGTPNKATIAARLAEAEAALKRHEGLQATEMPLDLMLRYMRDPAEDKHVRMAMAKAAAPYCHAQLQAVAHKLMNPDGTPIAPTVNLTIMQPPEPRLRLSALGPKDDATQHPTPALGDAGSRSRNRPVQRHSDCSAVTWSGGYPDRRARNVGAAIFAAAAELEPSFNKWSGERTGYKIISTVANGSCSGVAAVL
jgi:hypothetical protein